VFCAEKQRKLFVYAWVLRRFVFELWPARSPDLNPIDFYLWGSLKNIVYGTAVNDVAELQQKLEGEYKLIHKTPGIIERMRVHVRVCAMQKHKDNTSRIFCILLLSKQ
jgi:hypothetical protein